VALNSQQLFRFEKNQPKGWQERDKNQARLKEMFFELVFGCQIRDQWPF